MLTCSKLPKSSIISWATEGNYSHAALFLNNAFIFESMLDGSGLTMLESAGICIRDSSSLFLEYLPEHTIKAAVYRYPNIDEYYSEYELQKKLLNILPKYIGLDYSKFSKLLLTRTRKGLVLLKPIAQVILEFIDSQNKFKAHGPFCSELVARIYKELGLSLFDSNLNPEKISPNDLARSKLQNVSNQQKILYLSSEIEITHLPSEESAKLEKLSSRERWQKPLVKGRRDVKQAREASEVLTRTLGKIEAINKTIFYETMLGLYERIKRLIDNPVTYINLTTLQRLNALTRELSFIEPKLRDFYNFDRNHPLGKNNIKSIMEKWRWIIEQSVRMDLLVQYRGLRLTLKYGDKELGILKRYKIRRHIRKIVNLRKRFLDHQKLINFTL